MKRDAGIPFIVRVLAVLGHDWRYVGALRMIIAKKRGCHAIPFSVWSLRHAAGSAFPVFVPVSAASSLKSGFGLYRASWASGPSGTERRLKDFLQPGVTGRFSRRSLLVTAADLDGVERPELLLSAAASCQMPGFCVAGDVFPGRWSGHGRRAAGTAASGRGLAFFPGIAAR